MIRAPGSVKDRCAFAGTTAAASARSAASVLCSGSSPRSVADCSAAARAFARCSASKSGLRRPDRCEATFTAGQLRGELITTPVASVGGVLGRVEAFRVREQRLDLRGELTFGPHHPVVTHRRCRLADARTFEPSSATRPSETKPAWAQRTAPCRPAPGRLQSPGRGRQQPGQVAGGDRRASSPPGTPPPVPLAGADDPAGRSPAPRLLGRSRSGRSPRPGTPQSS